MRIPKLNNSCSMIFLCVTCCGFRIDSKILRYGVESIALFRLTLALRGWTTLQFVPAPASEPPREITYRATGVQDDQDEVARPRRRNDLPPATFPVCRTFDDTRQVQDLNPCSSVLHRPWDAALRAQYKGEGGAANNAQASNRQSRDQKHSPQICGLSAAPPSTQESFRKSTYHVSVVNSISDVADLVPVKVVRSVDCSESVVGRR